MLGMVVDYSGTFDQLCSDFAASFTRILTKNLISSNSFEVSEADDHAKVLVDVYIQTLRREERDV